MATIGGAVMGPAFWERVFAAPTIPGPSQYGPLQRRDANGLMLPEGFTSRVIARSGTPVVPAPYIYPPFPDGAHTFAAAGGGWIHVVNSEFPVSTDSPIPDSIQRLGGVSAIRFDGAGELVDAYRILGDTRTNCAGGATPWGTWLSCEEFDDSIRGGSTASAGLVWECDPAGSREAVVRPALGAFKHEAAAVDPATNHVYLTEDVSDGRLYRFTPASFTGTAKDLEKGTLQAAQLVGPKQGPWDVVWHTIADPSAARESTRYQVTKATAFDGGEGCFFDSGIVYFTTKGDNRVWRLDPGDDSLRVHYDPATSPDPQLTGVDNITGSPSGDLYVAEDGGNMEVVQLLPDGRTIAAVRVTGQDDSEIAGLAFD
ncbi:MAG: alkaline phosphatase PhoX, partial [Actinomycetota bacterium]